MALQRTKNICMSKKNLIFSPTLFPMVLWLGHRVQQILIQKFHGRKDTHYHSSHVEMCYINYEYLKSCHDYVDLFLYIKSNFSVVMATAIFHPFVKYY
jgi:hypothetical protein